MNVLKLSAALACAVILAGCSINVQDDRHDEKTATCSVSCSGKERASVTCEASKIPACSCEPTPTSTCIEYHGKSL